MMEVEIKNPQLRRIAMLIAYVTTDEVNEQLALQMAEQSGQTVCSLSPSDPPPDEAFDAAVYDWDYLPTQRQQAIRAQLLAGHAVGPVALHGYSLDDDFVEALRNHRVAVYRTLQPVLFRRLARECMRFRAACATTFLAMASK
jgi:hypothetical protein